MIPAEVLADARRAALADLTARCEIHRPTGLITNSMGERTPGWVPVLRNVPCKLVSVASVTGRERQRLEAIGAVTNWQIPLPAGTDVTNRDRIFLTDDAGTVRQFEVSQVTGPHTNEVRRVAMVDELA